MKVSWLCLPWGVKTTIDCKSAVRTSIYESTSPGTDEDDAHRAGRSGQGRTRRLDARWPAGGLRQGSRRLGLGGRLARVQSAVHGADRRITPLLPGVGRNEFAGRASRAGPGRYGEPSKSE